MAFENLDNPALDAAYASSYNAGDFTGATMYADEIISRMTSISGWLTGLAGGSQFPKYDAITAKNGGYTQPLAAQTSATQAITNTADAVKSGLKFGLPILAVIAIAGVAILYAAKK